MRIFLAASLVFLALFGAWGAYRSDEVWSVVAASQPWDRMLEELTSDIHPPLYYVMLAGWMRVFGSSEFAVRALSGVLYLAGAFAMLGLARRCYAASTASLAAAIYFSSPLALLAAQFARMYALLALLAILSTWLYLRLHDRLSVPSMALYAGVNVLGTFTHIWFFFLLFAHCVCTAIWFRRSLLKFTVSMAASLLPYAVLWLPTLLRQISKSSEATAWMKTPAFGDVGATALLHGGALLVILPVLLILWRKVSLESPVGIPKELLPAMLAITLGIPFLLSFIKPVYYSRFTIVGLPLFALLAAAAMKPLGNKRPLEALLVVAAIVGTAFAARPHPGDARNTARYLAGNARENDVIIFTSLTGMPVNYYLDELNFRTEVFATSFPAEIDTHPGYEGRVTDADRIPRYADEARALAARIRREHSGARVFLLHGFRPEVDRILKDQLDAALPRNSRLGYTHGNRAMYYTTMAVYGGD